ncbi:MAG: TerB family tellurite resistance protein [Planctomycetota bacterium]|nr:TerB family tellurite resistance protein [Planctomycetota bacterium]
MKPKASPNPKVSLGASPLSQKAERLASKLFRSITARIEAIPASSEASDALEDKLGLYNDLAQCVASFQLATDIDLRNPNALSGEQDARLTFAKLALRFGDFDLCETQLNRVQECPDRRKDLETKLARARKSNWPKKSPSEEIAIALEESKEKAPPAPASKTEENFEDVLLRIMILVALVDGVIADLERDAIASIYKSFGEALSEENYLATLQETKETLNDPVSFLKDHATTLSMEDKNALIDAALKVALTNGALRQQARVLLTRVALTLGLSLTDLNNTIDAKIDAQRESLEDDIEFALLMSSESVNARLFEETIERSKPRRERRSYRSSTRVHSHGFIAQLRRAMASMMIVDGAVSRSETANAREIYQQLVKQPLLKVELDKELISAIERRGEGGRFLKSVAASLKPSEKHLILRSAAMVAFADGQFLKSESDLLDDMRVALGQSQDDLEQVLDSIGIALDRPEQAPVIGIIKRVMVLMMIVDGCINDAERDFIRRIFQRVTKQRLSSEDLDKEVSAAFNTELDSEQYLKSCYLVLDEKERDLVYRAAAMVAAADGILESEEYDLLTKMAKLLAIPKDRYTALLRTAFKKTM